MRGCLLHVPAEAHIGHILANLGMTQTGADRHVGPTIAVWRPSSTAAPAAT